MILQVGATDATPIELSVPLITYYNQLYKFRLQAKVEGGSDSFSDDIIIDYINCDSAPIKQNRGFLGTVEYVSKVQYHFSLNITDAFTISGPKCPVRSIELVKIVNGDVETTRLPGVLFLNNPESSWPVKDTL